MKKITATGFMTFTMILVLTPLLYAGTLNVCYKSETGQMRILTDTLPNCLSSEIPVTLNTGTGTPETYTKHCEYSIICSCDNVNDRVIKWSYECGACQNPQNGAEWCPMWANRIQNNGNSFVVVCETDNDHNYGCDDIGPMHMDITCEKQ